jgi:hypothetical protein
MNLDPFTSKRITRFIEDHRASSGALPTLKDFEAAGLPRELIDQAVRKDLIELFYVTLTNGTIVKGYKIKQIK